MLIASLRDLRDFLRSKRIKREPLRFSAKGCARATYTTRDRQGLASIRTRLRESHDFSRASERIDALERELRKRHGLPLPLPSELIQNEDRSISLFYGGTSLRAFPDGIAFLIGGTTGHIERGIKPVLLEALALCACLQAS